MDRLFRRWRRLLVVLMPVVLVLVGCSGDVGDNGAAAPQGEPAGIQTINVEITDRAIQPSTINISKGQMVQLVLRNRGSNEHHFKVLGLVPTDLMWRATPEEGREEGVSDEEHAEHHSVGAGFVAWRGTSPEGIKPTGYEVHAYAPGGGLDVIIFTATKTGTFNVKCPLHPEIVGKVVVH